MPPVLRSRTRTAAAATHSEPPTASTATAPRVTKPATAPAATTWAPGPSASAAGICVTEPLTASAAKTCAPEPSAIAAGIRVTEPLTASAAKTCVPGPSASAAGIRVTEPATAPAATTCAPRPSASAAGICVTESPEDPTTAAAAAVTGVPELLAATTSQATALDCYQPLKIINHAAEEKMPLTVDDENLAPYNVFELFFTDDILKEIANNTNSYAALQQRSTEENFFAPRPWKPTNAPELRIFIAILIVMGVHKCKSPMEIWRSYGGLRLFVPGNRKPVSKYMGWERFCQIRRFLHIADPQILLGTSEWYRKLEPLNSHLRLLFQQFYQPSTNITVDEQMIRFGGRSAHTVRMPKKPIPEGFKVWACGDHGYTYDWRFHSRVSGIAEIPSQQQRSQVDYGLSAPTIAVVYELVRNIPALHPGDYTVYLDNLFTTVPLLRKLRGLGIGACGTAQVAGDRFPQSMVNCNVSSLGWNSRTGGAIPGSGNEVLGIEWLDQKPVHFLTTVHRLEDSVVRTRKKPRSTSTNARVIRRAFGESPTMDVEIPQVTDDYNHHKGGVDTADQYRCYYYTQLTCRRNWLPYFFWLLDITVVNSFFLFMIRKLGGSQWMQRSRRTRLKTSHSSFRLQVAAGILRAGYNGRERKFRKRWYQRKTARIYYSKNYGVECLPPAVITPGTEHVPMKLDKRQYCVRCRLQFTRDKIKGKRAPQTRIACQAPGCVDFPLCHRCFLDHHLESGIQV